MRIIKQRTDVDCGICCLAMYTGLEYEEVVKLVGDYYDPYMGLFTCQGMFDRLGYTLEKEVAVPVRGVRGLVGFEIRPDVHHMCYWDGAKLINPGYYASWELKVPHTVYLLSDKRKVPKVARAGVRQRLEVY